MQHRHFGRCRCWRFGDFGDLEMGGFGKFFRNVIGSPWIVAICFRCVLFFVLDLLKGCHFFGEVG